MWSVHKVMVDIKTLCATSATANWRVCDIDINLHRVVTGLFCRDVFTDVLSEDPVVLCPTKVDTRPDISLTQSTNSRGPL